VYSILQYGCPKIPDDADGQTNMINTWMTITRQLVNFSTFFDLCPEIHSLDKVADDVLNSPFVNSSDRLAFVSFVGILKSFQAMILDRAIRCDFTILSQWGFGFSAQCGVLASWVERHQGSITALYLEKCSHGQIDDVDVSLENVLKVVNTFPVDRTIVNATVQALADLYWILLLTSLRGPTEVQEVAEDEKRLIENSRAQEEAIQLEEQIRNALSAKCGKEIGWLESAEVMEQMNTQIAVGK
jgi:hypothetical protein